MFSRYPSEHQQYIQVALDIACQVHRDEWRENTELPYISHIFDIMRLANKVGIRTADWETYVTIILHDTIESVVENSPSSKDRVLQRIDDAFVFNPSIVKYVETLTFIPEHGGCTGTSYQKQSYLDSFANPDTPIVPLVIKTLDRLCNVVDFYNEVGVERANKYLDKATDLLIAATVTRFEDIEDRYGYGVADGIRRECLRVDDWVSFPSSPSDLTKAHNML